MRNYLTLAGKDSRDFGVYISGQGTFSAPEKAYTFYEVPGRNGAILGNENRLANIEVSYECFIYSDFSKNIADFRTFLLSLNGYQKLSDSYHPDEYRYAVYVGPFEPEVTSKNDAGAFTLTFNCKPQRFLTSGDSKYGWIVGGDGEISGNEITVYSGRLDESVFDWSYEHHALDGQTWQNDVDRDNWLNENTMNRICVNIGDETIIDYDYKINNPYPQTVLYTGCKVDLLQGKILGTRSIIQTPVYQGWTNYTQYVWKLAFPHDVFHGMTRFKRVYAANITEAIPLMSNYYFSCYYDETNNDIYLRMPMSTVTTPADVAYILTFYKVVWDATIIDEYYSDTLQNWQVPTLPTVDLYTVYDSYNKQEAWFTMKYLPDDSMSNPTMFPSEPLIRAYGTGSFEMDGVTVTITDCDSYVDIDCELMDCYEGSINRNNDVSFSTYDFPKLRPGSNPTSILSGITLLEIIPRWWRV